MFAVYLPYVAICPGVARPLVIDFVGVPYRIRTGVAAVRGRCPGPLDEGDVTAQRSSTGSPPAWQAARQPVALSLSVAEIHVLQRLLDLQTADHGDRVLQIVALLAGDA